MNDKLIKAAKNGDLNQVKTLVSQGADIHARDDYALRWSAYNGHLEVVEFLKSCEATCEPKETPKRPPRTTMEEKLVVNAEAKPSK